MARQPRFEYLGAVYHVMARGDGGKPIFVGKDDHESFLYWLERVCTSHGWRVHAWVLMGHSNFPDKLKTPCSYKEFPLWTVKFLPTVHRQNSLP